MSDFERDYLVQREELAEDRTDQSELRTELARERVELARERTHLANKRTFLAWCRTALAFMTFGFLLEKVGAFLVTEHMEVSKTLLQELGTLGKLAFIGGPLIMVVAGWRFYQLEREIGWQKGKAHVFPTMILFGVLVGAALMYMFW